MMTLTQFAYIESYLSSDCDIKFDAKSGAIMMAFDGFLQYLEMTL